MNTYRSIIYMCMDEIKAISDDSFIEEEHVLYLLIKYRAFLLGQRYGDIRRDVPIETYQTVCLDLELTLEVLNLPCKRPHLLTAQKIPPMMSIGSPRIHPLDFFSGDINLVSFNRFRYVGNNKYLKNIIYSTIAPDLKLYMYSSNPLFLNMEKVRVSGIFSDPVKAFNMRCDLDNEECDILDTEFPMEDRLISTLVGLVVKDLLGIAYRPQDNLNNATDDLSNLAGFLSRVTNRDFQKGINGEDQS